MLKKGKGVIFLFIISLLMIIIGVLLTVFYKKTYSYQNENSITEISNLKNWRTGKKIEYNIKVGYYPGDSDCIENVFVSSYKEFEKYINEFGTVILSDYEKNVLEEFDEVFFQNHTLAIEAHDASFAGDNYEINNIRLNGTEVNINMTYTSSSYGGDLAESINFSFIILDKNIKSARFNVYSKYINNKEDSNYVDKPIIYLYPTNDTEVSLKLGNTEKVTVSYPKYINGWKVLAKPNGDLIDLDTGRQLYSLYYESKSVTTFDIQKEGFIVKGEDSISFLEEKLDILGLTEKEAEEFIIYWLPKLENNKYNYIRFASIEEINQNMPLEVNPNPNTIIRVLMVFKGLSEPIEIEEQKLVTPKRVGFTLVEWGGTEIK